MSPGHHCLSGGSGSAPESSPAHNHHMDQAIHIYIVHVDCYTTHVHVHTCICMVEYWHAQ